MRIATFNILHGLPVKDGVPESALPEDQAAGHPVITDMGPFRQAIADLDVDVLAMQEVDRHQARSGFSDQTAIAAEALGAEHWLFAPSVRGTPGLAHEGAAWVAATTEDDVRFGVGEDVSADVGPRYGVSLISRHPVLEWRTLRLAASTKSLPLMVPAQPRPRVVKVPDEPRAAIAAVVDGPEGIMTFATVHLSFVPGFNMRQLRRVRGWLAGLPRPLVLMGDFNLPGGFPARVTRWDQAVRQHTYPSFGPRVQFDHVLLDGFPADRVEAIAASAEVIPLSVSDHCAVRVEL